MLVPWRVIVSKPWSKTYDNKFISPKFMHSWTLAMKNLCMGFSGKRIVIICPSLSLSLSAIAWPILCLELSKLTKNFSMWHFQLIPGAQVWYMQVCLLAWILNTFYGCCWMIHTYTMLLNMQMYMQINLHIKTNRCTTYHVHMKYKLVNLKKHAIRTYINDWIKKYLLQ